MPWPEAFLDAYRAANPDHEIDKMDLWDTELPELNMAMIDAKYRLLGPATTLDEREANRLEGLSRRSSTG